MMRAFARAVDAILEVTIVGSWSRLGYSIRRRLYRWPDLGSYPMHGKVVVLSGATSGIGRCAAEILARQGARLWLLVRDEGRGQAVRDELASRSGNGDIHVVVADLGDFDQIRAAAAHVAECETVVDVLIHLAGVLPSRRVETAAGVELTLATHLLGPWVLTKGLRPRLAAAGSGRVLWMSSGGMYTQRLALDRLEMSATDYKGATAYARAKRAQVVLAQQLSKEYSTDGVCVHALHPGWVDTPILSGNLPGFYRVMRRVLRTPHEGADTQVWLAASDEAAQSTGEFWLDRRRRRTVYLPWTRTDAREVARLIPWMDDRIARADARGSASASGDEQAGRN
ncbi:MAG: SDR family NAD(P)-dependent oxidoreductase [Gaiellaceae bacterium]